jgi:hypothetical protein
MTDREKENRVEGEEAKRREKIKAGDDEKLYSFHPSVFLPCLLSLLVHFLD